MKRSWIGPCLGLLFLCPASEEPAAAGPRSPLVSPALGVVVEEVEEGFAAHKAGLEPGDILLRWSRAASPPANPKPAGGDLRSPFDLDEIEMEQAPRGDLTVSGTRGGESLQVRLPPGEWKLRTRPQLMRSALDTYEEALALVDEGELDRGLSRWNEMASVFGARGHHELASWLFLRVASTARENGDWGIAEGAFEEAQREAKASGEVLLLSTITGTLARALRDRSELARAAAAFHRALELRQASSSNSLAAATTLNHLGKVALGRGDLASAKEFFHRSLAIQKKLAPRSLDFALSVNNLGIVAGYRGDAESAEELFWRSLAIREKLAPQSLEVAESLNALGLAASQNRGDLATAEDFFHRSLTIRKKLAPRSLDVAGSLHNLGLVASKRGDLATAEVYYHRSLIISEQLAPQGILLAQSIHNLGSVALLRGDLAAAEDFYSRSLAIQEKLAPQSLAFANSLNNLGLVAFSRGDLATATDLCGRALTIQEKLAPESIDVAMSLRNLGAVAFDREDFVTAEDCLHRSMAILEKLAPRSLTIADALRLLGDLAVARADQDTAEARYELSLAIRRERAPGSDYEAEACQRLAALHRRRGQLDRATAFYDCAVEALETQKDRLGGSDEVRSSFGAKYAGTYHEAIDLLVEVGRNEEAFHLLERYRASELLALLAQRDLAFSSDLPDELEKRRRGANRGYDVAFGQWIRMSDQTGDEERQKALEALERARRQQDAVRAEIRAAAPRLAALQDPEPMNLNATRAALEPGTLLLSYSIGETRSHLFAVGPQTDELRVFPLTVGEASLVGEVERFREAVGRGRFDRRPEKVLLQAGRLSDRLLAPAAAQIAQAERLLILADGPLHSLPFAALTDPGAIDGRRFLIEAKPVHLAASATVFALLKHERSERRPIRLTAFGDPQYPASTPPDEDAAPSVRAALRSFELTPLPATRGEVESLRRLHPRASQVFLGADATEGRAKAIGPETTHLHIATHGLLDDRFPLDSALAFAIPAEWREGEDNGLLQAWEIFEQVRIDADLVTLSACDTGLGKVLGGEGLMGLTRAFQYAGARSVLASLWSVGDESTAELMKGFYGHLNDGRSKAEALQSAQLDLIRGSEFSHPFHWAGFELVGDWR